MIADLCYVLDMHAKAIVDRWRSGAFPPPTWTTAVGFHVWRYDVVADWAAENHLPIRSEAELEEYTELREARREADREAA
jgi:hypothetical protein